MHGMKRIGLIVGFLAVLVLSSAAFAAEAEEEDKGLPLPLHTIEGVGGRPITPTAYLVNPPADGECFGMPAVSAGYVMVGEKDLQNVGLTWNLGQRLELGYAVNRLGIDDLDSEVRDELGVDFRPNRIYLHHFNARYQLIKENEWDIPAMPAITAGAHGKYNNDIDKINRDLGDAMEAFADYQSERGVDFTLTASKTIDAGGLPIIVSLGGRLSKASQFGLLGFGDKYMGSFEGNIATFVTDNIVVGAEYRGKPDVMERVPDLLAEDDAWWDVHAAYVLSPNSVLYAVAGDAGAVANHTDEMFYGMVFKYDF